MILWKIYRAQLFTSLVKKTNSETLIRTPTPTGKTSRVAVHCVGPANWAPHR